MVACAHRTLSRHAVAVFSLAITITTVPAAASTLAAADLADLTLEQLANVIVTSVSRREERLGQAAASVYVISRDDIRRSARGANLLARWSEQRDGGSSIYAQAYYDRVERDQPGSIRETLDIVDFEFQRGVVPRGASTRAGSSSASACARNPGVSRPRSPPDTATIRSAGSRCVRHSNSRPGTNST